MSYTSLTYHIVFATKGRRNVLKGEAAQFTHSVISQLSKEMNAFVHIVGGYTEHVHILVELPANISVSNYVKSIKQQSSKIAAERFTHWNWCGWEEGYSAFTVSFDKIGIVKNYIQRQIEHHRGEGLNDELAKWMLHIGKK